MGLVPEGEKMDKITIQPKKCARPPTGISGKNSESSGSMVSIPAETPEDLAQDARTRLSIIINGITIDENDEEEEDEVDSKLSYFVTWVSEVQSYTQGEKDWSETI